MPCFARVHTRDKICPYNSYANLVAYMTCDQRGILAEVLKLRPEEHGMAHLLILAIDSIINAINCQSRYGCGEGSHCVATHASEAIDLEELRNTSVEIFALAQETISHAALEVKNLVTWVAYVVVGVFCACCATCLATCIAIHLVRHGRDNGDTRGHSHSLSGRYQLRLERGSVVTHSRISRLAGNRGLARSSVSDF